MVTGDSRSNICTDKVSFYMYNSTRTAKESLQLHKKAVAGDGIALPKVNKNSASSDPISSSSDQSSSPCGHGGTPAVTPEHETKSHVRSGGLVDARKLAQIYSLGKFPFPKSVCVSSQSCKFFEWVNSELNKHYKDAVLNLISEVKEMANKAQVA
ncbi:hypothetical protein L1887_16342 [Cichorium endivia]|nr:hypothetical protein L1887_16342 [Cichorium endivia]